MTAWKAKVFWTDVSVVHADGGASVELDGRPVRTPLKAPLVVPSKAFADAIAAEWRAQVDIIRPQAMPFTRAANVAIDKVAPQKTAVADMLADYGGSDLLCYRASGPVALVSRQAEGWDPMLSWIRTFLEAPLVVTQGILPVEQPAETLARLRSEVHRFSAFELTGLSDLVSLSGSLVLALAAVHAVEGPETLWDLSRIDDDWQIAQWGQDAEAARIAAEKRADFLRALEIVRVSQPD